MKAEGIVVGRIRPPIRSVTFYRGLGGLGSACRSFAVSSSPRGQVPRGASRSVPMHRSGPWSATSSADCGERRLLLLVRAGARVGAAGVSGLIVVDHLGHAL